MKKNCNFYVLMLFLILCFSSFVLAQETKISPQKQKVIGEIISVTKADKKVKEIMQAMFKQMNANYPLIIKAMLEKRTDITPAQKAIIENDLIKKQKDFDQRFQQKTIQVINFQDFIETTFYPLYDKYFTEVELIDLLAFYKTPTGQKLNEILPQLSTDAIRLSQEYLIPKINGILEEVIREQTQKISSPPPPRRRTEK